MSKLTKLDPGQHADLKVSPDSGMALASKLHIIGIRVAEVGKASSSFPVFLTKNPSTGAWTPAAVASFVQGSSLFVSDKQWRATYLPTSLQTFPLHLMKSESDDRGFAVGFDADSEHFSSDSGEPLFDASGKPTDYLRNVERLLEAGVDNDIQTYHFTQRLEELSLMKAVDVLVNYRDGTVDTLKGLYTVDEEKLQSLSPDQLSELSKRGYLAPVYAMLVSIFQLNALIGLHNAMFADRPVAQVKLQIAREEAAV